MTVGRNGFRAASRKVPYQLRLEAESRPGKSVSRLRKNGFDPRHRRFFVCLYSEILKGSCYVRDLLEAPLW